MEASDEQRSLNPAVYRLWTPPEGRAVAVGPERRPVPLPPVPLPIHREDLNGEEPTDDAVGRGTYDYLRQFPDCPHNLRYAELLRDAFPHCIADLGAQAIMLDRKEVDAHYVRRKIACLQILLLLDPQNPALLQRLGLACFEAGMMFSELSRCRRDLLRAMGYLQRALRAAPGDLLTLNYLGQVDYLLGDFPEAARRWQELAARLEEGEARAAFAERLRRLHERAPDHPPVDDLEAIGTAVELYAAGETGKALWIVERLEEEGTVAAEFPSPEFYHLLGLCRGKCGDSGGAFAAFEQALALDPDYAPALQARERILNEGSL